jgi:putative transposase
MFWCKAGEIGMRHRGSCLNYSEIVAFTPRVLITDTLKSYATANKELGLKLERRQHTGLVNRTENSHQPTRVREKVMRGFKSARQLQEFVSVHGQVTNLFHRRRYNVNATEKPTNRNQAFAAWEGINCAITFGL